jgi:signal transduction histidine kinase
MSPILLHPHAVMSLILCLTVSLIILSFSRLKEKTLWTRWLVAASIGILGWQLDNVITFGLHPTYLEIAVWRPWQRVFLYALSSLFIMMAQIQLAYLFPENPYEKERKIVLRYGTIVLGIVWLFYIYQLFLGKGFDQFEVPDIIVYPALLAICWTIIVLARKVIFFRRRNREAMKTCILLIVMELLFIGSEVDAVTIGIYSAVGYWIYFLLTWIGILGGATLYIVYSTVPITFQLRLVGFTFILLMVVMSVVTLTFFPPFPPQNVSQRLLIQDDLLKVSGLIMMATVLVVVGYPILLRASIIKPLEQLLAGVNSVREGHTDTSVQVTSNDEIGFLTENFNLMTHTLKKAQDELASYASDLEKEVAQRTSELAETLENLKATQAQLIRKEKMASMGELMAGVAHEIQNPLNFVNNFSEFGVELIDEWRIEEAKEEVDKEAQADTISTIEVNLKKISEYGKRADSIVQGMLLQSRTRSGQKEATDMNELANEYLHLSYQEYLSQNEGFKATLQTQFEPSLSQVSSVVQDMSRVFVNIFNNAYYAVGTKTKMGLEACEPTIVVSSRQLADGIEIRIRDNGVGIPSALHEKVFQPFFTTKPPGQGVGLGLSLAYDILINDHEGTLDLISEEGHFAEFIFTLPLR